MQKIVNAADEGVFIVAVMMRMAPNGRVLSGPYTAATDGLTPFANTVMGAFVSAATELVVGTWVDPRCVSTSGPRSVRD